MKRKQIKDILFEMGASTKLLEMPAVMERIYNYYIDYSEEELRKEINIGSNGEIECKANDRHNSTKRRFCIEENGEVVFENFERDSIESNGRYFIDEFGMDRKFVDDSLVIFEKEYSLERTQEGIKINGSKEVIEDQGDPILNYFNYTVLKEGFSRTIGFEGNRDFLIKNYPITRGWFEIREGIRTEENVENSEHNEEVENLKNRIKTMEEQHKGEMKKLREEKESLQRMLKKTLEVCESVKRSPLGKLFFGRKLKELPEAPNIDER